MSEKSLEIKYPDFAKRFENARIKLDLDFKEISNKTGIKYEMIRRYAHGYAIPRQAGLIKLAECLNVSESWLQFGEAGSIPPAGSIAIQEEMDLSHTHKPIEFYDYKLSAGTGTAVWVPNRKESPLVFRENWFESKRLNPNDLRAMHIRGDSMTPELRDWDTVIIDITDLEIIDGEIYACVYKEKLYIKRIKRSEDGILLISSNPDYETMEVSQDTADRFQLLGRMVWRGG